MEGAEEFHGCAAHIHHKTGFFGHCRLLVFVALNIPQVQMLLHSLGVAGRAGVSWGMFSAGVGRLLGFWVT